MEIVVSLDGLLPRAALEMVDTLSTRCDTFYVDQELLKARADIISSLKHVGARRIVADLSGAEGAATARDMFETLNLADADILSVTSVDVPMMQYVQTLDTGQLVWTRIHSQTVDSPANRYSDETEALHRAKSAISAGTQGIVCAPGLIQRIKTIPEFPREMSLVVFLPEDMTSKHFDAGGATHVVVGSSVSRSSFPVDALLRLAQMLHIAL